jgi:hypothetical protein
VYYVNWATEAGDEKIRGRQVHQQTIRYCTHRWKSIRISGVGLIYYELKKIIFEKCFRNWQINYKIILYFRMFAYITFPFFTCHSESRRSSKNRVRVSCFTGQNYFDQTQVSSLFYSKLVANTLKGFRQPTAWMGVRASNGTSSKIAKNQFVKIIMKTIYYG